MVKKKTITPNTGGKIQLPPRAFPAWEKPRPPSPPSKEETEKHVRRLKACVAVLKNLHKEWHEECQRYKDYEAARRFRQRSPISALYLRTFHRWLFVKATLESKGKTLPDPLSSGLTSLVAEHPNYIKNQVAPYQTLRNRTKRTTPEYHSPLASSSAPAPVAPSFTLPVAPPVIPVIPVVPGTAVAPITSASPMAVDPTTPAAPPTDTSAPMDTLTDVPGAPVNEAWREFLADSPGSIASTRPPSPSSATSPSKRLKTSFTAFATPVTSPIASPEEAETGPTFEPYSPENIAVIRYLATTEFGEELDTGTLEAEETVTQRYFDHHPGVAWKQQP